MRLAKALFSSDHEDQDVDGTFWANMPADQPSNYPQRVDRHRQDRVCFHAAVFRFLANVAHMPITAVASTQIRPKTRVFAGKHRGNACDLATLFNQATWAKHVAALSALPAWADIESTVFEPTMAGTKDSLVLPSNRIRFDLVHHAFEDVTTGPWSMDKVLAVRRQRRFAAKMVKLVQGGAHAFYHFHTEALVQYPKFLAVMAVRPTRVSLVPTNPVDLAWQMHQLTNAIYARQTLAITGLVANHNDANDEESKMQLTKGVEAMPEFWMRLFGEDYFHPNVSCATGAKYKATDALVEQVAVEGEHSNMGTQASG
ncbi:hypothetical protein GGF31_008938 [Allomyces arbusculus]|nr:hypothetical protein GGF31_008938 [Allomyces arbusculus]